MGKKETKMNEQAGEKQPISGELPGRKDIQLPIDRPARHLSEIDRREGEMNHGETGGNFRPEDPPGHRA